MTYLLGSQALFVLNFALVQIGTHQQSVAIFPSMTPIGRLIYLA